MSKYFISGKAAVLRFDFLVEGQPVVPSSATYTVLKNDYSVVSGLQNQMIALGSGNTYANISIPESANLTTLVNELRYVNVEFIYQGKTYLLTQHYFLVANINFPLTKNEVRSVLGVSELEVMDEAIDIISAYNLVKSEADINLDNVLSTGSSLLPTLILAVKYKAALESSIAIETSVMQSEQADNTLYTRFQKIDFAGMRRELTGKYNEALRKLNGIIAGNTTQRYSLIAVGTDPVTGT